MVIHEMRGSDRTNGITVKTESVKRREGGQYVGGGKEDWKGTGQKV
jgi:hypothetical protein